MDFLKFEKRTVLDNQSRGMLHTTHPDELRGLGKLQKKEAVPIIYLRQPFVGPERIELSTP
jgi:hypothetical protein